MLLKDKSVVIMGAGSGVGRAAALIFARNGAKLVCADIAADRNAETVAMVEAEGYPARGLACDVANEDQVKAAVDAAVEAYGRLDVIFNNVGVAAISADGTRRPFDRTDTADFDRLNDINFRGMVHGCRQAIRQFLAQGDGGTIVNTGSVAGLVGWGPTLYGATKAAGIQLTRSLAIEYAPKGIRANIVCPAGMITNFSVTPGTQVQVTPELEAAYGKQHPLGRAITPEDTANAALFLASDLSRNITGVTIPVDGGYVAA